MENQTTIFCEAIWDRTVVTVQGKCISLKVKLPSGVRPGRKVRGKVSAFSARSRFRMLVATSRILWKEIGDSRFLTLTYPDDCVHFDSSIRNNERWRLWKSLELFAGKPLCGVWRVEWVMRKSGTLEGVVCPHLHMMVFNDVRIGVNSLSEMWKDAIQCTTYPNVHSRRVNGKDGVVEYVSKYCGKVEASFLLGNVSYLEKIGRHYGWFRKSLIPWAKKLEHYDIPDPLLQWLQRAGRANIPWLDLIEKNGWTLIGDAAEMVSEQFSKKLEIFLDSSTGWI